MVFVILFICFCYSESTINDKFVLNNQKCLLNETILKTCTYYQQPISLFNCVFNSFKCSTRGGAIFFNFQSKVDTSNITCCTFIKCTSTRGGAIFCKSLELTNMIYNQCIFIDNFANDYAGAIYSEFFNSSFNDCQFTNNSVTSALKAFGGAIYSFHSSTYFYNCLFDSNKVEMTKTETAVGGALYFLYSTLNFMQTDFFNNAVISHNICDGGTISLENSNGNFVECNFRNNTCYCDGISSSMYSSVIDSLSGNLNFRFCSFINNSAVNKYDAIEAKINGGVLCLSNCNEMLNCVFCNNLVNLYGKSTINYGLIWLSSWINFFSCEFSNNSFVTHGDKSTISSILMKFDHISIIKDCIFNDNTANALGQASSIKNGLLCIEKSISIINSRFINNSVLSPSEFGVLNAQISISAFFINNCSFIDNDFPNCGDICINFLSSYAMLTIDDCLFEKRKSEKMSFISINNAYNNTYKCSFTNNRVLILNTNEFFIFDGNIANNVKMIWKFENNCLFDHDNIFYAGPNIHFYDETNKNLLQFKDVFKDICDSKANLYTESQIFSQSDSFSNELTITESSEFNKFSDSSNELIITESSEFNKFSDSSNELIITESSESNKFSDSSNELTITESSESNKFSDSSNELNNFNRQTQSYQDFMSNTISKDSSNTIGSGIGDDLKMKQSKKMNTSMIIGIVIAIIALILTCINIIIFIVRRQKKPNTENANDESEKNATVNTACTNSKEYISDDENTDAKFWL